MNGLTLVKRVIGIGSVAVGIAALIAPRRLAAIAGVPHDGGPEMVAAFGAKELAAGGSLLAPVKPGRFLWARVAGHGVELVGLAAAYRKPGAHKPLLTMLAIASIAVTIVDLSSAFEAERQGR